MAHIHYFEETNTFKLDTEHCSYVMAVVDEPAYLGHVYYGKKVADDDLRSLLRIDEPPYVPSKNARDKLSFLDSFPMEYPTHGIGDFREDALRVRSDAGHAACELHYTGYEILDSKPALPGLPATFGEGAHTLIVSLADSILNLEVKLYYAVFDDNDAILRWTKLKNVNPSARSAASALEAASVGSETLQCCKAQERESLTQGAASALEAASVSSETLQCCKAPEQESITQAAASALEAANVGGETLQRCKAAGDTIYLDRALSASFDMDDMGYELLTLNGSWARERHIDRRPIGYGFQGVSSDRGESSHQHHPFIALLGRNCTQQQGEAYGLSFCYSGNFIASVYKGQFDNLRVMMGINPEDFSWELKPGESFTTPEVALVYSDKGLGGMSRTYHDLYRDHLIRSAWKDELRPILINNWEATYFDFDDEKLLAIAKEAAKSGIEMLVMDDGWFGKRCDDNRALGDWQVNEDKLKGGLKKLVDAVNALGLKFGIWFEPEMISPDSDLYRAHPDWAIAVPGRQAGLCRNQYVLDLSRGEVKEYVFQCLTDVLDSANIEYVKWDMNRQLADLGSYALPAHRQGELTHRYVLAVYELQERLMARYPKLLLENCSGGGARYDAGMLYYSPQIWCSDDTDAVERLMIQEGTALVYPLSTMGAHVSDCPNHAVGRITPFETRGQVALAGTFGYELDITRIPDQDRELIPKQVEMYKKYHMLIAQGDYYRLESFSENGRYDAYMVVSKDKKEALLSFVNVLNVPNAHSIKLKLAGLAEDKLYSWEGGSAHGISLMNAGILMEKPWGDFTGQLIYFKAE